MDLADPMSQKSGSESESDEKRLIVTNAKRDSLIGPNDRTMCCAVPYVESRTRRLVADCPSWSPLTFNFNRWSTSRSMQESFRLITEAVLSRAESESQECTACDDHRTTTEEHSADNKAHSSSIHNNSYTVLLNCLLLHVLLN
jgi:hypothetical protein